MRSGLSEALPETDSVVHAGPKADWGTAEGCRQHTVWSKRQAGWRRWEALPRRQGASWCFDGAALVAVGAYLVLQKREGCIEME